MSTESLDFFLHLPSEKPRIAKAQPTETLAEVLRRMGVLLDDESHLFISHGDSDDSEADSDEDSLEPVSASATLAAAGIRHHSHLHCHRCHRIEVSVNFQGETKTRKFAPNARIARVRRWALRAFQLTGPAASDFILQLCGSDQGTRPNQDLAELVTPGTCSICFDLTKEVTPQG